jgi:uncharacterized protein (TIGR02145 family)
MLALCHLSTGFSQELDEILEAEGFTLISSNDSTSFWLSEYPSSFVFASEAAEAFGGHLATFSSLEENDAVWQALQGVPVIFGLTLQEEWTWVTGEPLSWTKWDTSQPTLNGENSGHLRPNGKWNDVTDDYGGYRWLLEVPLVSIQGGCTHIQACNYDSTVLFENGTCEYVSCHCLEGTIWNENLGGCVGSVSADLDFDGCVGMSDLLNLLSVFGTCAEPDLAEWTCGDPLEYQGYDYSTVLIGEQCWFAENCRYLPYLNEVSDGSNTEPRYYILHEDHTDLADAQTSMAYQQYGALYNLPAALTGESLCPVGWHIPDIQEWQELGEFAEQLGPNSLKSDLWGGGGSGFNALPAGHKANYGDFVREFEQTDFWSSTVDQNCVNEVARLKTNELQLVTDETMFYCITGNSARCIKDPQ